MRSIQSSENTTLKHIRKLFRDGAYRRRCGEFIIEGRRVFDSAKNVRIIILREETPPPDVDLLSADVVRLSSDLFDRLSDEGPGQGLLAVCGMPETDLALTDAGRYVFLDGLQDPGNAGTIIRTSAAFGLQGVLFGVNCADPFSPKVVRSSAGGIFKVPIVRPADPGILRERRVLLADMRGSPLRMIDGQGGFVVVIGNEGAGVSDEVSSLCTTRVSIPMPGGTESLNAAVAAGIILYELCGR